MIRELSRVGCSSKSEQSILGERENTMDLIRKSEKINTLVKEQIGYEIRLFLFYFFFNVYHAQTRRHPVRRVNVSYSRVELNHTYVEIIARHS